ncbi:MAG: TonB-dependent receptor [Acidobacteria bacterium]|nr:MAG: TonB-dependent receptor [Acidobacteriota bacterium]
MIGKIPVTDVFRRGLLIVAAALLLPTTAVAQFDAATVLGTVRDSSGAIVPGATVTLTNAGTGITASAVSDEHGNYQFLNVRIGTYSVRAELQGFSIAKTQDVDVTVNARLRVDLMLKVGDLGETVTVTGAAKLLETESSDRGQVIAKEQIVNLPLNGRAYADLALLSPGVRRSAISDSRDASFNVHGLRSALNSFILDGVDNNSYGTSNQGFSNQVVQVSPDAVEQFKVQTNNFSAEFGRTGGAVVNATMRSGTNAFQGTAWEFHRNDALNAVGFFKPSSGVKPKLVRNQFGFVFGGPVIRNRTFFFVDYEGFRQISKTTTFASIPTLEQRQGILGKPILNPLTGEVYANGVIPASAITAFARKVLADLPAPTLPGISNNFDSLPRRQDFNNKFDVKVDHQFGPGMTAFVRVSHRKVDNFEPSPIPGDTGSPSNAFVHVLNDQVAGGYTYSPTANSLLEMRLGWSHTDAGKQPPGVGGPTMLELYGIPGLPSDPRFAGGLTEQGITGWTTLGRQNSNPQFQNPSVFNPRINYSWVRGRQSFKSGYEYQAIATEIDDFHPKYGRDTYGGQFSRPAGAPADPATYNLADFMFGARNAYSIVNSFIANLRQRMHFAYVQDDVKVNQRLTLNLGLRYEFATPQWEKDNFLTNFDPATNTLIQAKDGSIDDRALVNPDRNNFAPRLGLAYSINEKTILRAGYGMSYIHFNRLGGENLLSFNGPHVVALNVTQQPSQGVCGPTTAPTSCFRTTQEGYPEGLNVPSAFNTLNARVNYIPRDNPTGNVTSWHASVQRELLPNLLVDVGYVGNKSRDIMILADYNQARPNAPNENTALQARRPIPGFQEIQIAYGGGKGDYHALQMKVERRYTRGLYLLNSFTWSRARDNASGHLEVQNGDNSRVNFRDLDSEFGTSGYDQPLNNTTSFVWELPFGRDRRYANSLNPIIEGVLGGWRVVGINTMTSGVPINLSYSPAAAFQVSGLPTYRPNLTGNPLTPEDQRTISNYLNPATVEIPTDRSQPFGNAPRNVVRSNAFYQFDLGLHKTFGLWREQTRLEARIEAFNLFNTTNFGPANGNRSASSFGAISTTFPARQIQLGMKVYF